MRPIIFRGKRVDGSHGWVFGNLIEAENKCFIIQKANVIIGENNTLSNSSVQEVIPETVGQYINRDDNNGVNIFEGCIVLYSGAAGIVFYDKDSAMFMVSFKLHRSRYSFDSLDEEVEVIGNIHDNKNLING